MTQPPPIAEPPNGEAWHNRSAEEVLADLSSSATVLRCPQRNQAVWRISLFTNVNLAVVVVISFGLQGWSQPDATRADGLLLLGLGVIPLLVLEMVKVVRNALRQ